MILDITIYISTIRFEPLVGFLHIRQASPGDEIPSRLTQTGCCMCCLGRHRRNHFIRTAAIQIQNHGRAVWWSGASCRWIMAEPRPAIEQRHVHTKTFDTTSMKPAWSERPRLYVECRWFVLYIIRVKNYCRAIEPGSLSARVCRRLIWSAEVSTSSNLTAKNCGANKRNMHSTTKPFHRRDTKAQLVFDVWQDPRLCAFVVKSLSGWLKS